MNLVEYYLNQQKKCIILISGFLWWDYFYIVVKFLADNLGFEIIYTYPLIPPPTLIKSATEINFPALNETIKERLNKYTSKGYIIISYTFPPEHLDFYPNLHINLNVNPSLLSNITIDYINKTKIPRINIDEHINYILGSWKTNKINTKILYNADYKEKENILYGYIFDAIMHYFNIKVYGEKYIESLNNKQIIKEEDDLENVPDTIESKPPKYLNVYDVSKDIDK